MPYDRCPVLGSNPPETIPYEMVHIHEKQALANHYQTLDRLIERGGLSWTELLAILKDEKYENIKVDEETAKMLVGAYVKQYEEYKESIPVKEAEDKVFIVPVSWQMSGYVVSIAKTAREAWEQVKDNPENYDLPDRKEYIEDSFEPSYDNEETVEELSELYRKGEFEI